MGKEEDRFNGARTHACASVGVRALVAACVRACVFGKRGAGGRKEETRENG